MPTFTHGAQASIFANGYNVSPYFASVSTSASAETAEVTTLGATSKAYIPGIEDATFSLDGFYDGSAGAIDAQMQNILGAETVWTVVNTTDAVGAFGYAAATIGTTYEIGAEIGGAVSVTAEGQTNSGANAMRVLHPLAARTTSGTGTQLDNSASSANGVVGYLQVTAVSGTTPSITAKVQHSTDGSTWADLVTFTAVTASNNAQRIAVSGTVNRYLRALWTISGTTPSATFHLSAARL
jgi:hypothetical protein